MYGWVAKQKNAAWGQLFEVLHVLLPLGGFCSG
jgi:hypothetical protein